MRRAERRAGEATQATTEEPFRCWGSLRSLSEAGAAEVVIDVERVGFDIPGS
ncbi:hypothetical protein ACFW88_25650 [Streptomyces anandii]|uniref:Uncharacterized protein n=1 Tax=Streptomyces anandii TaxID=285454 RepID=A0ABW6HB79_9ACTN